MENQKRVQMIFCCPEDPLNLETSKCFRSMCPDGTIMEVILFDGNADELSQAEQEEFILRHPISNDEWDNVRWLIDLRNELVHFKSAEHEQIAPRPKVDVDIMRRVPNTIKTRSAQRAWPYRLLTPSLAGWAHQTAQSAILGFKTAYKDVRIRKVLPTMTSGVLNPLSGREVE
jgi:hypothetical protein